jgi:hypothetical protein
MIASFLTKSQKPLLLTISVSGDGIVNAKSYDMMTTFYPMLGRF